MFFGQDGEELAAELRSVAETVIGRLGELVERAEVASAREEYRWIRAQGQTDAGGAGQLEVTVPLGAAWLVRWVRTTDAAGAVIAQPLYLDAPAPGNVIAVAAATLQGTKPDWYLPPGSKLVLGVPAGGLGANAAFYILLLVEELEEGGDSTSTPPPPPRR